MLSIRYSHFLVSFVPLLRTVNVIEAEGAFMMLKEEKSKKKRNNNTIDGLVLHSKRSIFQSTLLDNGIAIINVFLRGHKFPSLIVDAVLLRNILLCTRLNKNR